MVRLDEHNKAICLAKIHLSRFAVCEMLEAIFLAKYAILKAIRLTKTMQGDFSC